jgi:23S rRNA (pseudouridine1915-N3)-methyltransferase
VKFLIVALGHRMPAWVKAGFEDYARRMPRDARMTLVELKSEPRVPHASERMIERTLEAERRRIVAALPKGCYTVVLDERGIGMSTQGLARRIETWRQAGGDVAFVIGGADGIASALKQEADLLWSLSALTLPHQLVRIVLAEQLYRATSVLGGHPYHRPQFRIED